jgi:hypothetical protein
MGVVAWIETPDRSRKRKREKAEEKRGPASFPIL